MIRWFRRLVGLEPRRPFAVQLDLPEDNPGLALQKAVLDMQDSPAARYSEEELAEIVAETREPAIGLARVYPPDPSRGGHSCMGGAPNLPAEIAWPVTPGTDTPRILVAQIDCADLPGLPDGQHSLPETGTLWFFADRMLEELHAEPENGHVLYHDSPAGSAPQRHAPDGPPWWEGAWGRIDGGRSFGPLAVDGQFGRMKPYLTRWELDFAALDTYRSDWNQDVSLEDDADTRKACGSADDPRPRLKQITFTSGEWEPLGKAHAQLTFDAWAEAFGVNEVDYGQLWDSSDPWRGRREHPFTWLGVRFVCSELAETVEKLRGGDKADPAVLDRLQAIVEHWQAEADTHPTYAVMAEERKNALLDDLQTLPAREEGTPPPHHVTAGFAMHKALEQLADIEILQPGSGPAAFDPAFIAQQSHRHRPITRVTHHNARGTSHQYQTIFHRLLGAAAPTRFLEEAPRDHIVLAEFVFDRGLELEAGDLWSLIYWILPQDLAERDFSKVRLSWGQGSPDYDLDQ